jgi:hypothetical protein
VNIPLTVIFKDGNPSEILLSDTIAKCIRGFPKVSNIRLFEMLSDYSSKNGYDTVQNIEDPFICTVC